MSKLASPVAWAIVLATFGLVVIDAALFRRSLLTIGMAVVLVLVAAVAIHLQVRVQRLQPLVTLCAWSKTVQDGDEWISFERYLERRFGVRVTHGQAPEEVGKLLDDKIPPS